jgi:hypothetical protein
MTLPKLPVAPAGQVVGSRLNASFVEEVPASINDPRHTWRTSERAGGSAAGDLALITRVLEEMGILWRPIQSEA